MNGPAYTCPMTREQVIDQYFLEHRARMLDIAAFLDRVDRASPAGEADDYRVKALIEALKLVTDGERERVRRVLDVLSDPSVEPIAASPGKGAVGAHAGKSSPEPRL